MNDEPNDAFKKQTLVMQVIVGAAAMGVLVFGMIVAVVLGPADTGEDAPRVVAQVALLAALAALVGHRIIGSVVASAPAKGATDGGAADPSRLVGAYQTGLIVSLAMLEGAAMLCLVVYGFLYGDQWLLAMAGLLLMAILVKFPFAWKVQNWIEQQSSAERRA